jgi:hypothetical protein
LRQSRDEDKFRAAVVGNMSFGAILGGAVIAALGVASILRPREVARFSERLDAIGSKRAPNEVEPAEWYVKLTRISGVVFALLGTWFFVVGISSLG